MKRSEWYKLEQELLIKSDLSIESKDYIQGLLERALLTCGTVTEDKINQEKSKADIWSMR